MDFEDPPLVDDDAGPMVRPYMATRGRTKPTTELDLLSMVRTTGRVQLRELEAEQAEVLMLCGEPISVAELAAHMRLPAMVVKVLLSDLVECGAVAAHAPNSAVDATDQAVLEALLNGLQRRL